MFPLPRRKILREQLKRLRKYELSKDFVFGKWLGKFLTMHPHKYKYISLFLLPTVSLGNDFGTLEEKTTKSIKTFYLLYNVWAVFLRGNFKNSQSCIWKDLCIGIYTYGNHSANYISYLLKKNDKYMLKIFFSIVKKI